MTRPTPEQVAARMKLPFSPGPPPKPKDSERLANARKLNAEANRIEQSDTTFRDLAVRLANQANELLDAANDDETRQVLHVLAIETGKTAEQLLQAAGAKP